MERKRSLHQQFQGKTHPKFPNTNPAIQFTIISPWVYPSGRLQFFWVRQKRSGKRSAPLQRAAKISLQRALWCRWVIKIVKKLLVSVWQRKGSGGTKNQPVKPLTIMRSSLVTFSVCSGGVPVVRKMAKPIDHNEGVWSLCFHQSLANPKDLSETKKRKRLFLQTSKTTPIRSRKCHSFA